MTSSIDGVSTRGDRRPKPPSDADLVRKPLERLRDRLLFLTAGMPEATSKDYFVEIDAALAALVRMEARWETRGLDPLSKRIGLP